MKQILEIWTYKYFICSSIKTDFISRFTRSKLGGLWIIINPLMQVLMYAIVLSSVLSSKLPGIDNKYSYAIYLIAGMLFWSLFNEIFLRCVDVFVSNANIIKKIPFPKLCLPIIASGTAIINNIIFFLTMIIVFLFLGHDIGINLIYIPLLAILTILLALSGGMLFGIINVFVRDVSQIMSIAIQFLFWFTPIVYMINILPQKYYKFIYINPLTSIAEGYHQIILYNKAPDLGTLLYPFLLTVCVACLAIFIYNKADEEMADVL
ncbi:ABC transporter permease [Campylobacter fetus]|uniref:Transport permease protein n=1 Tax=Campylobacter fetus TaxID=196 RepID=A0A5L8VAM3_CAMFE|nr:ABC transporter permease [Campylobacter fetus]EAI5408711.1 ABC transporter permease [Campylobacter fetus]EAJ0328272.1 ABC transporter permease [Campylobacter fetus]EAJ1231014.1 ABC transporter permease [Campylobacter fetus]EAK0435758.1 ABC transporter permease [Campylobacter fetus]EAK0469380.1 ABC transporter permease [Campylobacter fetus]